MYTEMETYQQFNKQLTHNVDIKKTTKMDLTLGGCPPGWDTMVRPCGLLLMVILTGEALPGVLEAVV